MAVVELEPRVRQFIGGQHRLLIGGSWVEAAAGETFETVNPSTEEVLAQVARGRAEDIDRAVAAARAAFEDGSDWRRMTPSERGRLIHRVGDLILEHADELAMLEALDNGKSFVIARHADVVLAADLFHYMSGWATKIEGNTIPISAVPAPGEYLAFTLREPVGVVGQIIPWNFPLLMAAWKLGPVLAAGCTVVLKPAEQTPLSALRLGELLLEAGLPSGVVNIVTGFGEEAGAPLAAHPAVDKVAFTGSTPGGRRQPEEGLARAGRQVAERRLRRRRHAGGDPRGGQRDLLQPRPVLQRRLAAVRRAAGLRRGGLRGGGGGQPDQGRAGHGPGDHDGSAHLRRAVHEGARLPGFRPRGRRA